MISLSKRFSREYDEIKEFRYSHVQSSTVFPIKDLSPIQFEVSGVPNVYIDPQEIYINLDIKIFKQNPDGTLENVPDGDPVALEQAPLYTLFKDIVVSFNHIEEETNYGYYAYKAYIALMLSTTTVEQKNILSAALYVEDQAGALDYVDPASANARTNPGSYKRNRAAKNSKTVNLSGKLLVDTLQVDKPILDKVSLTFVLYPATPEECLVNMNPNNKYIVQIENCYLTVGRIIPKTARITSRSYNFLRHVIKKIPHSLNQQTINPIVISRGQLRPKYITIGIVTEDSLASYAKARFNFLSMKLQNITLTMDGRELPYSSGYNMDYANASYVQPYCGLFHELQTVKQNTILPQFPYSWFKAGFALYVFNCERDHSLSGNSENSDIGNIELSGRFKEAPAMNVIFIVMISYDHSYEIDIHRNVLFKENATKNTNKTKILKRFRK